MDDTTTKQLRYRITYLIILAITISTLGLFLFKSLDKVKFLEENNLQLKIKTENLSLFTEDKGRILKVESILYEQTNAKKFLGDRIPSVAVRVLSLCQQYKDDGLTLPTIMGIIETESDFNPKAISKALDGETPVAYGLMQVVRGTATPILKDKGYTWNLPNILQPELNMDVGVTHLIYLHRQFVSLGLENINEFHVTLIAYNRGERIVLESINTRKRASISLDYLGRVKLASRKWENVGL